MPEPNCLVSLATKGESHGWGAGPAGFAGAAGLAGAAAAGFSPGVAGFGRVVPAAGAGFSGGAGGLAPPGGGVPDEMPPAILSEEGFSPSGCGDGDLVSSDIAE